jgi:universal stress protein A
MATKTDPQEAPVKAWRRILVPTDFSVCSRAALQQALELAAGNRQAVEVVHIVPGSLGNGVETMLEAYGVPPDLVATAEERLRTWLGEHTLAPLQWRVLVGDPAREIVALTAEGRYDLVVLGTHGRTGLSRLLLGSVAERVVREAPCPVLTIRGMAAPVPVVARPRDLAVSL